MWVHTGHQLIQIAKLQTVLELGNNILEKVFAYDLTCLIVPGVFVSGTFKNAISPAIGHIGYE
jgi:hypothetical protein